MGAGKGKTQRMKAETVSEAKLQRALDTLKIEIHPDYFVPNPREDDNMGTMYTWDVRAGLGDKGDDSIFNKTDHQTLEEAEEFLEKEKEALVILPLNLLDHSGLILRAEDKFVSDPQGWDTTMIGFVYVTREQMLKSYGNISAPLIAQAKKVLKEETEVYSKYLGGDVHFYEISDQNGNVLDSCEGIFGYEYADEIARDQARDIAQLIAEHIPLQPHHSKIDEAEKLVF